MFRPAKASKRGTVWAVVIQSLSSFLLVGQKATRKTGVCLHILARPLTVQPYFATSQPEKGCLVPPTPAGRKWACFLKRSPKLVCFLFKANQPWASFKTKTGLPQKRTRRISGYALMLNQEEPAAVNLPRDKNGSGFVSSCDLLEQGPLRDTFCQFETWLFPPKERETTIDKAMFRCTM